MDFFAAAWNSAQWTLDARFAGAHGRREFEAEGLGSERGRFALGHGDRFGADRLGGEVELRLRSDWLALLVELWRLGAADGEGKYKQYDRVTLLGDDSRTEMSWEILSDLLTLLVEDSNCLIILLMLKEM